MKAVDLKQGWQLKQSDLLTGVGRQDEILRAQDGWMPCSLPCDIHMPLIEAGIIRDPVKSDYCFESEWIEKRAWWFRKCFDSADLDLNSEIIELVIESIDAHGDVFLNGVHLGRHISAFYPFVRDIKDYVTKGENVLAVRVTTGLEEVSEQDLAELNWAVCHESSNGCPERGDLRRSFVRKPTYSVGWDWGPKVLTCGIVKGARIVCCSGAVIRGVKAETLSVGKSAVIAFSVETELLDIISTAEAILKISVEKGGKVCASTVIDDLLLTSGINFTDTKLVIEDPQLWWPNGCGDQPLYTVSVSVCCRGADNHYDPFEYGIRTISLDLSRIEGAPKGERNFTLVVNGVPVFCKGGDWIPADSVYARVTKEKYDTLIEQAVKANFNMLRIWGGGFYEQEEFYNACDRSGILLWHDFMFGCTSCPDHLDWFRREVEQEMNYQTKHLRNRACLALWCGNNENHWIFNDSDNPQWNISLKHDKQYGLYTANVLAVNAVRNNCPHIPYWNSSPYGGDLPNSEAVGDVHHWKEYMMNAEIPNRIEPKMYDNSTAKFVTEYGYPGSCPIETIRDYFDGKPVDRCSPVWDLHNNTFEKHTVVAGIEKHYVDDAADLPMDTYIFYSGMVQSTMLQYSLEAFRFKENCSGGLFWMYNDTWGEVGWTIIDYYLRRKVSYYGVKRAFAPIKLILRACDGGKVRVMGCNDTAADLVCTAKAGYLSLDGKTDRTKEITLTLPAHSRGCVYETALNGADDYTAGLFGVIVRDCDLLTSEYLRMTDYRNLNVPDAEVRVLSSADDGADLLVTVTCDTFAHGVRTCGGESFDCSDLYFDLFPGESRTIRMTGAAGKTPSFRAMAR